MLDLGVEEHRTIIGKGFVGHNLAQDHLVFGREVLEVDQSATEYLLLTTDLLETRV